MTQIHCRCSEADKITIEQNAALLNMTITELVLARCKNIPVQDKEAARKIYQAMMALTSEMNYIGKNINQAVVAIHQLKFVGSSQFKRLDEFNTLFKEYLSKRDALSSTLEKVVK
jgi:hypothetical protein